MAVFHSINVLIFNLIYSVFYFVLFAMLHHYHLLSVLAMKKKEEFESQWDLR